MIVHYFGVVDAGDVHLMQEATMRLSGCCVRYIGEHTDDDGS